MANSDQSLYNLRYNQVSNELEGFGGGVYIPITLTNVDPTQVPVTRLINTTAPLTGGGNLSADRTISIPAATSLVDGYLLHADWTTFNGKQPAGTYITALTGDATASGPGSAALTLATVNSNVGSFTSANITVDAKGRITAAANGTAPVTPKFHFLSNTGGGSVFTTSATYVAATTFGGPAYSFTDSLQKSTNKWKLSWSSQGSVNAATDVLVATIFRDGVDLFASLPNNLFWVGNNSTPGEVLSMGFIWVDAPGDTASHTYAIFFKDVGGGGVYLVDHDSGNGEGVFVMEEVLS